MSDNQHRMENVLPEKAGFVRLDLRYKEKVDQALAQGDAASAGRPLTVRARHDRTLGEKTSKPRAGD